MTILKEYVLAVTDRQDEYKEAESFYEGEIAEVFSSLALKRLIGNSGYNSRLNFCRPIVDAVQNRVEISAVVGTNDAANKVIGDTWEKNELILDANEIHKRTLEYGDCYAMVWPDEDGNWEISYNSPRGMALVYDPESPRKKLYAVKMWEDADGTRLNVYTAEAIVKYRSPHQNVTEGTNWDVIEIVPNEFGQVPVFHFRTSRPFGRPEHRDAYDAQNYINKEFIQSMETIDYQGAPQRYALAVAGASSEMQDFEEGDTDRENMGALKNGPGELWYLNNVNSVGEFKPADPEVFWGPIKNTVRAMASLTATPLHYFEKTGNVPSGEALRVAEAPLIKKVRDRCLSFGQTWREIFMFILRNEGIDSDVEIKWKEVESLDELERLDAALKKRNIGISIKQTLLEMGYDSEVADRIIAENAAEKAAGIGSYGRAPQARVSTTNNETNAVVDSTNV
jgi:hypothetical protein